MADIYELADEQREAILRRDRMASSNLVRSYSSTAAYVREQADEILRRIQAAEAKGDPVKVSWLDREARLSSIETQIRRRMSDFADAAYDEIEDNISDAAHMGARHAGDLLDHQLTPPGAVAPRISFRRLPEDAVESVIQMTHKGALRDLVDSFGPTVSDRLRQLLVAQIATGRHPETTARMIRDMTGAPLTRAVTIARTEAMRAYREAHHRGFTENADVISGWYWYAKLERTTCPACWAMHGVFHKVEDRLYGHPRCRCTMIPFTKTWEELGFPGVPETRTKAPEPGASKFLRLPEADQRAILGKSAFDQFRAGNLRIRAMAHMDQDPKWGPMVRRSSLQQALEDSAARGTRPKPARTAKPPVDPSKPVPGSGADVRERMLEYTRSGRLDSVTRLQSQIDKISDDIQRLADRSTELWQKRSAVSDRRYVTRDISNEDYNDQYDRYTRDIDKIDSDTDKLWAKMKRLQKQRDDIEYADFLTNIRREFLYQKGYKGTVTVSTAASQEEQKSWKKGVDGWRRLVGDKVTINNSYPDAIVRSVLEDPYRTTLDPSLLSRSYHRPGQGVFMAQGVRDDLRYGELHSTHATVVHELTHWLESADDYIHRQIVEFYDRRTKGEPTEKLKDILPGSGYADSEVARRDKFMDPYMGKDYGPGGDRSHELFTMGVQRLYATPIEFAEQDPDMFDWVIDVLRRRLP